jgi:hypothetical protein
MLVTAMPDAVLAGVSVPGMVTSGIAVPDTVLASVTVPGLDPSGLDPSGLGPSGLDPPGFGPPGSHPSGTVPLGAVVSEGEFGVAASGPTAGAVSVTASSQCQLAASPT